MPKPTVDCQTDLETLLDLLHPRRGFKCDCSDDPAYSVRNGVLMSAVVTAQSGNSVPVWFGFDPAGKLIGFGAETGNR